MTDYNKLTVVKLKEILKDRELPTSGLKAALVARLVEDDAKPAEEAKEPEPSPAPEVDTSAKSAIEPDAKPSESVVEQPPTKIQDDALPSASAAEEQPTVHPPAEVQDNTLSPSSAAEQLPTAQPPMEVQDDTLPPTSTVEEIPTAQSTRATSLEKEELPQTGVDDVPQIASQPSEDAQVAPTQEQPPQEDDPKPPVAPETEDIRIPSSAHTIIEVAMPIESNMSQPGPPSATEILVSRSQPLPSKEQPGSTPEALLRERSTQASVDRDELMEDSRKRKRRSQSPPPSTLDTAIKKAKALDGSPRVVMQEDLQTQQHPTQETELNYIGDSMELDTQERPKNEDPIDSKTQYSQETAGPSHYIKSLKRKSIQNPYNRVHFGRE